ncbi:WD40 repeat-containing protein SMU1 [Pycnococcus provasolii]
MASPASSTLVPSTSVVRIVEQFLLENNLTKSFEALKEESAVALNAVPGDSVKYALVMNQASASTLDESALAPLLASSSSVFSDVLNGRLDRVLTALAKCELTPTLAVSLYTQVLLELLELKDAQSARMLLRQTRALGQHMKTTQPKQYTRLDQLISRSAALTPADIYGETTRDARRRALVCALAKEVRVVAPGRLLDAVGNGIKYLRVTGRMYELVDATSSRKRTRLAAAADDTPSPPVGWDLLLNTELSPAAKAARRGDGDGGELPAISHANGAHSQSIKFGTDSHPTCASYSPDGFFIATGSSDGFVEIWDARTCKLATSLDYQKRDEMLAHNARITCVAFSRDGELLASGDASGTLKVWRVASGRCLRKWEAVHGDGQPIRAAEFAEEASAASTTEGDASASATLAIVSAGGGPGGAGEGAAKLLGLRGGATMREYHISHASSARLRVDGSPCAVCRLPGGLLAVGTTDGCISIYKSQSGEHVRTFAVPQYREGEPRPAVVHLSSYPPRLTLSGGAQAQALLLVGSKSTRVHLFDARTGVVVRDWRAPGEDKNAVPDIDSLGAAVDAKGELKVGSLVASAAKAARIPHFVTFAVSARGRHLYVLDEAGALLCYELASGTGDSLLASVKGSRDEPVAAVVGAVESGRTATGCISHPVDDVLTTLSDDGSGLKVWRAS